MPQVQELDFDFLEVDGALSYSGGSSAAGNTAQPCRRRRHSHPQADLPQRPLRALTEASSPPASLATRAGVIVAQDDDSMGGQSSPQDWADDSDDLFWDGPDASGDGPDDKDGKDN